MKQECIAPLRLGLVGLNFGQQVAVSLVSSQGLPVRLTKVCDLNLDLAIRVAAQCGVGVSPSLDALLEDPDVDAVVLISPPAGRAKLLRKIIRAGRDVMTTKPFETDPHAAMEILLEAKALGRVIHLNSPNARPYGEMEFLAKWISEGAIGRPVAAHGSSWAYYGETKADGSWHDDPSSCPVAPVFRIGIYPLNNLVCLLGCPQTVQVATSRVLTEKPTPDNAQILLSFPGGVIASIAASFAIGGGDAYKNALTICGTDGVIYYRSGPSTSCCPELMLARKDGVEQAFPVCRSGDYDWDFFVKRVRGEIVEDSISPDSVARAVAVVHAMGEAERSGLSWKVLDPALSTCIVDA